MNARLKALFQGSVSIDQRTAAYSTNRESDCLMKTVISACLLTVGVFAGASAISFAEPVVMMPSMQTNAGSPSGPADWKTAQKYGRIDHSSLMSASILPAPNPAPAAVAAYETPPQ
jgi:hypothetical protein